MEAQGKLLIRKTGGMGEWLKPAVLKTVSLERGSGVRIPLPPPFLQNDPVRAFLTVIKASRRIDQCKPKRFDR